MGRYQAFQRDAFFQGTCDDGVHQLCAFMGWSSNLDTLIKNHSSKIPDATSNLSGDAAVDDLLHAVRNVKL